MQPLAPLLDVLGRQRQAAIVEGAQHVLEDRVGQAAAAHRPRGRARAPRAPAGARRTSGPGSSPTARAPRPTRSRARRQAGEDLGVAQRRDRRLAGARGPRGVRARAALACARRLAAGHPAAPSARRRRPVHSSSAKRSRTSARNSEGTCGAPSSSAACQLKREAVGRARDRRVEERALDGERVLAQPQAQARDAVDGAALGVAQERLGPRRRRERALLQPAEEERADAPGADAPAGG